MQPFVPGESLSRGRRTGINLFVSAMGRHRSWRLRFHPGTRETAAIFNSHLPPCVSSPSTRRARNRYTFTNSLFSPSPRSHPREDDPLELQIKWNAASRRCSAGTSRARRSREIYVLRSDICPFAPFSCLADEHRPSSPPPRFLSPLRRMTARPRVEYLYVLIKAPKCQSDIFSAVD